MPKYTTEQIERDYRNRPEGAEGTVRRASPPDPREQLDAYLRWLERTQHYDPIREVTGVDQ